MKNNYIFYIYYFLVLILTLGDIFFFNKVSTTIFYGLASAFIGIVLQVFYIDYQKQKKSIVDTLTNIPKIEFLHEEEFYSQFRYLIKKARINVDITHLSLESPINTTKSEQKTYYSEFVKIVKNKKEVSFRRVERVSQDKINWIEKLLRDFKNVPNFSLYCIIDSEDLKKNELSDLLSIQRIDSEHTFIIALLEHHSTIGQRDLYFRDKSVTSFFTLYYQNRLVNKSVPILVNGHVDREKWEEIKLRIQ